LTESQAFSATRIDFYVEQLKAAQPYLPKAVQYLVGDGNYSFYKFLISFLLQIFKRAIAAHKKATPNHRANA
jgi:hypothetical protein